MIIRQLALKELTGTKLSTDLPKSQPIAVYSEAELETLLAGTNPEPQGIRFHLDRPSGGTTTVGLIAVSLIVVPFGKTMLRNSEFASGNKKYVQRGTTNAELTTEQFQTQFASLALKGTSGNNSVCVFFSRTDLREILDQQGITRIAFFPTTIQRNFTGRSEDFDSLLAIGQTSVGITGGIQIQSEMPCPPHCADDYP